MTRQRVKLFLRESLTGNRKYRLKKNVNIDKGGNTGIWEIFNGSVFGGESDLKSTEIVKLGQEK